MARWVRLWTVKVKFKNGKTYQADFAGADRARFWADKWRKDGCEAKDELYAPSDIEAISVGPGSKDIDVTASDVVIESREKH